MSIVGLGILGWGIYECACFVKENSRYETCDDAQVEQYISPINVRATGYIDRICFTEHQHVSKGDTLLIMDQREYALAIRMAKANIKDAATGGNVLDATVSRTQQTATTVDNSIEAIGKGCAKV